MEVIKVSPGDYCYGVVDTCQVVQQAIKNPHVPRPIHFLGQIIHNLRAAEALAAPGAIILDGPDRACFLEQAIGGTVVFMSLASRLGSKHAPEKGGLMVFSAE